jgi:hypothetical protein
MTAQNDLGVLLDDSSDSEAYQSDFAYDQDDAKQRGIDLLDQALDDAYDSQFPGFCLSMQDATQRSAAQDARDSRDIWAEMEQNERMAHITGTLNELGYRPFDTDEDDGDVVSQPPSSLTLILSLGAVLTNRWAGDATGHPAVNG